MEDLGSVSTASDGCNVGCSSYSPKFRSQEVSVSRDSLDSLSVFGRNTGQKATDDHACERDYGSCTRVSEPDRGSACDFEDGNMEPVSQGPVLANALADEEFAARFEALEHENGKTIDSMRIMNRMTVNANVEEEGCPQLGNKRSGSIMGSMNLPKRLRVSAVRNFPDAFQQCDGHGGSRKKACMICDFPDKFQQYNGHNGSQKKAPAVRDFPDGFRQCNGKNGSQKKALTNHDFPDAFKQCNGNNGSRKKAVTSFDAVQIDFGDLNGASDFDDDLEPNDTDFLPLRNTVETEVDLLNHDLNLGGQELMYAPGKEKVLKLAAYLVDSEEGVASITPLTMLHASDWKEQAKYIIPLAIQEHDYAEVISQTDAAEQAKLENNRAGENFFGKLEISKPVKQKTVQVRAYLQLNHKTTPMKMHHKGSAVRDFPVAFKLGEEKGGRPDSQLVKKSVTAKISLKQGQGQSFQGRHQALKESEHRKIEHAPMAAPRCPWRSKKSRGSKKRKHKKIVHALMAAPRCPWRLMKSRGSKKRKHRKIVQALIAAPIGARRNPKVLRKGSIQEKKVVHICERIPR